jgi:hypothetical protein
MSNILLVRTQKTAPHSLALIKARLDGRGVDRQFCPDNQLRRARYHSRIAGHPGFRLISDL